jgi:hypothetical protein
MTVTSRDFILPPQNRRILRWDITQHIVEISYQRFGITYLPYPFLLEILGP